MDASSSSRFSTAKAEASPSTVNDIVAELEAVTMVGAEGATTSQRTEYYSARCEAMMRSRAEFSDDIAMEIEFSKSHFSEVSRLEVAPQSAEERRLHRENREVLKQLTADYPYLFGHDFARYVLGPKIAEGGQAEIYEVVGDPYILMKVFKIGTLLRDLQRLWPLPVLNQDVPQCILCGGMLEDGRFVFLMRRCWGDLRKFIDQVMLEKNVDGSQGPPFPYNGRKETYGWNQHPLGYMYGIAWYMMRLHDKDVTHRDLKASNVLLSSDFRIRGENLSKMRFLNDIFVADFECSIGVLGTGFWRAPEILVDLKNAKILTNEQWKKADVYSYGMICFEIVTGRIPFDGELGNGKAHRQLVIDGKRPQLPSDLEDAMKDLITQCWESNPNSRPTFATIVNTIWSIATRESPFRLFGIGDELPPQYRLATVQEVNDCPLAVMEVMPGWEIANLADGSVDGHLYGMHTRLEKRSNVGHKLARLLH